jgi:hypothetical protein
MGRAAALEWIRTEVCPGLGKGSAVKHPDGNSKIAAAAVQVLVIVHPGSACGSADFQYASRSIADAERQGLIDEFNSWAEGVIVIDGELSDELRHYPKLKSALDGVVALAKAKNLIAIRKTGGDPQQGRIIRAVLKSLKLSSQAAMFQVTGAWYYGENQGCVGDVCNVITSLGYQATVSSSALTGMSGPDDDR